MYHFQSVNEVEGMFTFTTDDNFQYSVIFAPDKQIMPELSLDDISVFELMFDYEEKKSGEKPKKR